MNLFGILMNLFGFQIIFSDTGEYLINGENFEKNRDKWFLVYEVKRYVECEL